MPDGEVKCTTILHIIESARIAFAARIHEVLKLLSSAAFFFIFFFQNQLVRKIHSGPSVSNSLDPDQTRQNVGPDLGPNCLQTIYRRH